MDAEAEPAIPSFPVFDRLPLQARAALLGEDPALAAAAAFGSESDRRLAASDAAGSFADMLKEAYGRGFDQQIVFGPPVHVVRSEEGILPTAAVRVDGAGAAKSAMDPTARSRLVVDCEAGRFMRLAPDAAVYSTPVDMSSTVARLDDAFAIVGCARSQHEASLLSPVSCRVAAALAASEAEGSHARALTAARRKINLAPLLQPAATWPFTREAALIDARRRREA